MGLIKAISSAVGGSLADQWLEVIEPNEMGDNTVFTSGVIVEEMIAEDPIKRERWIRFPMDPSSTFILINL